ncbi:MAG: calcium-binding protein [Pseudomonadota bacterium]
MATTTTIVGTSGNDTLIGANHFGYSYTLKGLGGHDSLVGASSGNDSLQGDGGNDSLYGNGGYDTLRGGLGNDLLDAGPDIYADLALYDEAAITSGISVSLVTGLATGGAGNDTLTGIENILGTAYADSMTGDAGNNFFWGAAGNDSLSGGTGNDSLAGGKGDDSLSGDGGQDTAVYDEAFIASAVVVSLVTGLVTGGGGSDTLTGIENVSGTVYADSMVGDAAANKLLGGAGKDTLTGGDGDDTLDGGYGDDSLTGGDGNDTLIGNGYELQNSTSPSDTTDNNTLSGGAGDDHLYSARLFGDLIDGGAGIDTVSYDVRYGGGVQVSLVTGLSSGGGGEDTLTGIENIYGSVGDDTLTGDTQGNLVEGGEGSDRLNGGAGNDTLYGDASDMILYDDNRDTVLGGSGNDELHGGNSSGLLDGGTGNDTLYGAQYGRSTLNGGAGNDLINGSSSSSDTIDGGAGADTMMGGGSYSDIFVVDNTGDVITGATGASDTVWSSISFTLGADIEHIRLTTSAAINATGNSKDNTLSSGDGDNMLDGAGGTDTVNYQYSIAAVTVNLGSGVASGGSGNDTLVNIENIIGSRHNDTLIGNDQANQISGGTGSSLLDGAGGDDVLSDGYGHDTLNGGAGADTMNGGTGDNLYIVDSLGDVVVERLWYGGTDTVWSSISFKLGGNLENLRLTASTGTNATGNSLNNTLFAGAGNNILNGSGGLDTASYSYSSAGVHASLTSANATGGSGNDTFFSIENLAGSDFADKLTGSIRTNRLEGGTGNDSLNGGAGADTLLGGAGDDEYIVDNAGDVVTESSTSGTDSVISRVSFTLGANLENLRLAEMTAINATGNSLNNVLAAGEGDNVLNGSGGIDTASYAYTRSGVVASLTTGLATGGSGNDSLISIENLIGSNYADSLTGNIKNNDLAGGHGNDTLSGGAGQDLLTGGKGADTFDFNAVSEMGLTADTWDSILDFNAPQGDKLDLSTLDADTTMAGKQSFSFIGSGSFTAAGQLRYDTATGVLYGSVDADLDADFAIELVGSPLFTAAELIG